MAVEPNRVGQFPFPKSDPQERKKNFAEVQQSYTEEEVMREAEPLAYNVVLQYA